MENCLIADIGGTNCRFFLYKIDSNNPNNRTEIFEKTYSTKSYKNIYQPLDLFLDYKVCKDNNPKFCVIAIAGAPVNNCLNKLANIDWEPVNGLEIATKYTFAYCRLLNDFEAVAYAFFTHKLESISLTRPAITSEQEVREKDTLVVMGYGTGLGTVLVRNFSKKERYTVIPQEGGHTGFSPKSDKDWEVMKSVRSKLNIPDKFLLSQELFCCGVGVSAVYEYFHETILKNKAEPNLTSKKVFELLSKEANTELKTEFFNFYLTVVASSWAQLAKSFLGNGGHLVIGGIITALLKQFYDNDINKFLDAIKQGIGSEEEYRNSFDHVHFHFYENDTQVFAVEGSLNFNYLNQQPTKINRFKKNSTDNDQKIKSIIKKHVEDTPVETKAPKESNRIQVEENKKVIFDNVVSEDFEDFYWSNILKNNVMTITGFFNARSIKSKLLIGRVISEPTYKTCRIEKSKQRFQCYKIRFLDTICNLLVPTNLTRLLIEDIVLINDKDKLYHTKEDGWYFQTFDNVISDINVTIFNNLIDKFIKKPLMEMDKIHSKIKFDFTPTYPFNPRQEFDPERLLLAKPNQKVKSYNILIKILEVLPSTFIRRSNELVEEFTPCKVQSQKFSYVIHFPKWSGVPTDPFYGYFIKEDVILPGYIRNNILVMDDYTIINSAPEFAKYFPEGPLLDLKIGMMKVNENEGKNIPKNK